MAAMTSENAEGPYVARKQTPHLLECHDVHAQNGCNFSSLFVVCENGLCCNVRMSRRPARKRVMCV
jgi:hypothetical protein